MDQRRFFEIWTECLQNNYYGKWMVEKLKGEFDSKQEADADGNMPELTWQKVKSRITYYKVKWELDIPSIKYSATDTQKNSAALKNEFMAGIVNAASGYDPKSK